MIVVIKLSTIIPYDEHSKFNHILPIFLDLFGQPLCNLLGMGKLHFEKKQAVSSQQTKP